MVPALVEISRPPLVNLTARRPAADRYSYNFEGDAELIDYVIVSPSLARGAEVDLLHVNADCPSELRASDHDPQVARLRVH